MDIKATPQNNRFRRIGLPLTVALVIIAAFGLVGVYAANQRSTAPDPFAPYDPATYGIPEILAGYRIVAVYTPKNMACTPPDEIRLTIQAVDPSPDNPMVARGGGDIMAELKKFDPNTQWELTYVMPVPLDRGKFLMVTENHNQSTKNDCIRNAPIITLTPDPFAPYDPATYNIPEIVAGYRILVVQNADNTACMMPTNAWRVLIQPVDPMPDNPMVAKGNGDVIFELKKLYPNVEWEITYSTPSSFDRAQFAATNQSWNKGSENGCLTTGPMIPITDTPDPFAPYAPATFGIPEILAGYRILAIRTADNTACMKPDIMEVVVQAVDPMPDNPMVDKGNGDVIFELKKLYPNAQWGLGGMGPAPFDRAQFVAINDNWNKGSENGCINIGVPITLVTETPDPFAPYAPATYGLPEIVAGYRIVAVHSSSNTPCMAVNQIRLTIQAVDPSPDNPMVDRNGGDIIFEVKKLHPDIDWQLEYIMPQPITQADHEQFLAGMETWKKEGCVTLGGPRLTDMPSATP
jgi:hypothetical protein